MKNSILKVVKRMLMFTVALPLLFSGMLYGADLGRVMLLGDSITYDNNVDDLDPATQRPISERIAYRGPLWTLLTNGGYTFDFVGSRVAGESYDVNFDPDNEGWPGITSAGIADRVIADLNANPADIILLHIGTNGLTADINAVERILDNIDTWESTNNPIKVILALIINRKSDSDAANITLTSEFNDNLEVMANQRIGSGDNIVIVDMENDAGFVYDDSDMADFLHPNDIGYEKMAQLWYGAFDTIPPVITLNGENPMELLVGETFTDPGATAIDDIDGTVPVSTTDNVNTSVAGTYTVTYTATDSAANEATQTRTVNVSEEITPPTEDELPDWAADESSGNNTVIRVTPEGSTEDSIISAEDISPVVIESSETAVVISYVINASGCNVFIKALKDGTILTGYTGCENGADKTLKEGTVFALGTQSVMKKQAGSIVIMSTVKLNKNESFTIGGI